MLNINYSTAKTILRVYRIESRILKKSPQKKKYSPNERVTSSENLFRNSDSQFFNHNKPTNSHTHTEESIITVEGSDQEFINHFRLLVNSLQHCISEVINNEIVIKNICMSFNKNYPTLNLNMNSFFQYAYNAIHKVNQQTRENKSI